MKTAQEFGQAGCANGRGGIGIVLTTCSHRRLGLSEETGRPKKIGTRAGNLKVEIVKYCHT